jgi:hypothetical protein
LQLQRRVRVLLLKLQRQRRLLRQLREQMLSKPKETRSHKLLLQERRQRRLLRG